MNGDKKIALLLDFSNTITTVESEDAALKNYLEFIASKENIDDKNIVEKFTNLRSNKLIDRERRFRTFLEINKEVLKELYNLDNVYANEYYRFHEEYLRLRDDFIPFVKFAKEYCRIVMVTDADNEYTKRTVASLGIGTYFDFIVTAEDVRSPKPNPEIFQRAINLCNGSKVFWHVGDSERRDIVGAKKLGIYTVRMTEIPVITVADSIVSNFSELRELMIKMGLFMK